MNKRRIARAALESLALARGVDVASINPREIKTLRALLTAAGWRSQGIKSGGHYFDGAGNHICQGLSGAESLFLGAQSALRLGIPL